MTPCRVANGPMSTDVGGKPAYSAGKRTAATVHVNLHTKRTTMNGTVAGTRPVCDLAGHPGNSGGPPGPRSRVDRQGAPDTAVQSANQGADRRSIRQPAASNQGRRHTTVADPSQESTGRTIMKTRTLTLCALVALMLTVLAGHPRPAEARDNIFVGADLGGLFVHFDNYPRHAYGPPPPHHYRSWGPPPPPRHYRSWGPPPPPRYWHPRPYYRHAPPPPHHYPYGRSYRHW